MNADEDYGFDIAGFIHLHRVLTAEEVNRCSQAIDAIGREEGLLEWPTPWSEPFRKLQQHPVLKNYLQALCGPDFALEQPPRVVAGSREADGRVTFAAGDPELNRRLRYVCHGEVRVCNGVRVVLALAPTPDQGGLVVVPASHKRDTEPPADFLAGADDMGMNEEPVLEAGDILICAATTLSGIRGQPGLLIEMQYINAGVMPAAGFPEVEAPDWTAELTPEQMAVVGVRATGRGGKVLSNGAKSWVSAVAEQPASVEFGLDENSIPVPEELWFWDIRGYLVLRGVMDEEWLVAANRAIEATLEDQPNLPEGHLSAVEEVPEQCLRENDWEWPADTSPRIRGEIHRPRLGGLYQLPKPHCEPFRKMIGYPPIVQRLNWMLGYGFHELGEPMCCVYPKGTTGGSLHAQNPGGYRLINSRQQVEQVNVAWALHDEAPGFGEGSGGFVCVPGSHKASYPIPRPLTTSIDLPQVYKPSLKAGDVLFFGAVSHGTTAWRSDWHRRTVIQFTGSANGALRPANKQVGWRWSTAPENSAKRPAAKS